MIGKQPSDKIKKMDKIEKGREKRKEKEQEKED
jgi:hypothetical protein